MVVCSFWEYTEWHTCNLRSRKKFQEEISLDYAAPLGHFERSVIPSPPDKSTRSFGWESAICFCILVSSSCW